MQNFHIKNAFLENLFAITKSKVYIMFE